MFFIFFLSGMFTHWADFLKCVRLCLTEHHVCPPKMRGSKTATLNGPDISFQMKYARRQLDTKSRNTLEWWYPDDTVYHHVATQRFFWVGTCQISMWISANVSCFKPDRKKKYPKTPSDEKLSKARSDTSGPGVLYEAMLSGTYKISALCGRKSNNWEQMFVDLCWGLI